MIGLVLGFVFRVWRFEFRVGSVESCELSVYKDDEDELDRRAECCR